MATNPIDRNKDSETSQSQGEEAARIGPNVSPEHRAILEAALAQRPERSLFEILAAMPDAGEDSDFARSRS
jgi:antitoxin FitA